MMIEPGAWESHLLYNSEEEYKLWFSNLSHTRGCLEDFNPERQRLQNSSRSQSEWVQNIFKPHILHLTNRLSYNRSCQNLHSEVRGEGITMKERFLLLEFSLLSLQGGRLLKSLASFCLVSLRDWSKV